jgi:DNA polymerase III subunit delta'
MGQILVINDLKNQKKICQNYFTTSRDKNNIIWMNQDLDSIKIKEIRELISQTSYAHDEPQYYCLLNADKTTLPAQNALLKLLEEPPKNVNLILAVSELDKLLPTVQSRCVVRNLNLDAQDSKINEIDFIFPKNYSDIIALAEKYKDRGEAIKFIKDLINFYSQNNKDTTGFIRQNLLSTLKLLESNINTKLTLENCFFQIKNKL